jgi:hypothetical protein
MITAIVIPADPDQPVRQQHIEKSDLSAYRQIVGGHLKVLNFDRPPASMYVNEEGKLNRMRLNHRATTLMWVHNSAFRGQDVIAGPAFIVGRPDRHGDDKSVPDDLLTLLLNTKRYRVQLQTQSDTRWSSDNQMFAELRPQVLALARCRVHPVTGAHVAPSKTIEHGGVARATEVKFLLQDHTRRLTLRIVAVNLAVKSDYRTT